MKLYEIYGAIAGDKEASGMIVGPGLRLSLAFRFIVALPRNSPTLITLDMNPIDFTFYPRAIATYRYIQECV